MPAGKHPRSNFILFIMALSVMLEVCRVHGRQSLKCCTSRVGRGSLGVLIQRAARLYADPFSKADAFVKMYYDGKYEETRMITDDDYPEWNAYFNFGSVEVGLRMKLEVWDKDVYYDDLVGRCYLYPERGIHSMRCRLSTGVLYFTYILRCDAHLTGSMCGQYSHTE